MDILPGQQTTPFQTPELPVQPVEGYSKSKKIVMGAVALLIAGAIGMVGFFTTSSQTTLDPNEAPPSLTTSQSGLKGQYVETAGAGVTKGFLKFEDSDVAAYAQNLPTLITQYGNTPGIARVEVKKLDNGGEEQQHVGTLFADKDTFMSDFIKSTNPGVKRVFYAYYSPGEDGLEKGFHVYPEGSYDGTFLIKDPSTFVVKKDRAFYIIAQSEGEVRAAKNPTDEPTESMISSPIRSTESGWVQVALKEPKIPSPQRVIAAWVQTAQNTYEKADLNNFAFRNGYHTVWLHIIPDSGISSGSKIESKPKEETIPVINNPSITKVDPGLVYPGDKVTMIISGKNFDKDAKISFEDTTITIVGAPMISTDGTTIIIDIVISDSTSVGNKTITVTNPKGTPATNSDLKVDKKPEPPKKAGPEITSVTPSPVKQGENALITIAGINLDNGVVTIEDKTIQIIGKPIVSTDQIVAIIQVAGNTVPQAKKVTVTNENGTDSNSDLKVEEVKIPPPPVKDPIITDVGPNWGKPGETKKTIVITGANFDPDADVTFEDTNITIDSGTPVVVSKDGKTITVVINIAGGTEGGKKKIIVVNKTGKPAENDTFQVKIPPKITSVLPLIVYAGDGQEQVMIVGTNLDGAKAQWTDANGGIQITDDQKITGDGGTLMVFNIKVDEKAAAGPREIQVSNDIGSDKNSDLMVEIPKKIAAVGYSTQQTTLTTNKTYATYSTYIPPLVRETPVGPKIISITPLSGYQGETKIITIKGADFAGVAALFAAEDKVIIVRKMSSTNESITVQIKIDSTSTLGNKTVTVKNAIGQDSNSTFRVVKKAVMPTSEPDPRVDAVAPVKEVMKLPTIDSVSPSGVVAGTMQEITIKGSNLKDAKVTFSDETSLSVLFDPTVNPQNDTVTFSLKVASDAKLGTRNITIEAAGGTVTKTGGLNIIAPAWPAFKNLQTLKDNQYLSFDVGDKILFEYPKDGGQWFLATVDVSGAATVLKGWMDCIEVVMPVQDSQFPKDAYVSNEYKDYKICRENLAFQDLHPTTSSLLKVGDYIIARPNSSPKYFTAKITYINSDGTVDTKTTDNGTQYTNLPMTNIYIISGDYRALGKP